MARERKRLFRELRLRSGGGVALLLVAGLVALAVTYRQPIAEYLLMVQLRKLGLDRVEFAVGRFNTGLLELQDLRVGGGDDLEIASIEARFSMTGLFGSRLDALRVSGAHVRGTLDDSGLSFGDLDALLATDEQETRSSGPTVLPASGIEVDDARLELDTEAGPLEARLSVRVQEIESGQLEGKAELSADHSLASLAIGLAAKGSPGSLAGDMTIEAAATGELGAQTTAEGVSLLANAEFSFDQGDIAIRSDECAAIHIAELSVRGLASLAEPLDLCLRFGDERAIRRSQAGALEANLELEPATFAVDVPIGTESLRVSGELPAVRAWISGGTRPFDVAIETEAGKIELSNPEVGVCDLALATGLSFEQTAPSGRLRIQEIFDLRQPPRFPNMSLDARFEPDARGLAFEIDLADAARNLVFEIAGSYDPASSTGRAVINLERLDLLSDGVQPADLVPALAGLVTEASGSIGMDGFASVGPDGVQARFAFDVVDLSVTSERGSVERMNAKFTVGTDGIIEIESASVKLAGGTLTTAGTFNYRAPNQELSVLVKDLDLAKFVTWVNLEGLSGSGTLDGEVPIVLNGDDTEFRNAELHAVGRGDVIQYRPEPSVASLGEADEEFATVLEVLENFHYERIGIGIDGKLLGSAAVQLHLKGVNPDYEDGHPVELNIPVEAPFSGIFKTKKYIFWISDQILKRLRAAKKQMNTTPPACVHRIRHGSAPGRKSASPLGSRD